MIRSLCIVTAGILCFGGTITAQPTGVPPREMSSDRQPASSFEDLELRGILGETVYVIDTSGRETRGRVATLSDVALTVTVDKTRRAFAADDVRRIDRRRRDSVWNGLLMGAGAGALLGFGFGRSVDSPACPRPRIECGQGAVIGTVGGGLWGAVGGWITDALIRKREIIYAPRGPR